MTWNEARLFVP